MSRSSCRMVRPTSPANSTYCASASALPQASETGCRLPVPPLPAQRRQADAGRIKTAVDGEDLSGDVARSVAAQEEDRLRQFLFQAVAIERNGVVIVGADFRRVHGFRHRGLDRTRRDRVDADAE